MVACYPVIEVEVRELLRELVEATGAVSAAVIHERPRQVGAHYRLVPLGNHAFLRLDLVVQPPPAELMPDSPTPGAIAPADKKPGEDRSRDMEVAEAMDRCARALRACARRWDLDHVPACTSGSGTAMPGHARVHAKITSYLQALANTEHAVNAVVTLRRQLVASSYPVTEQQYECIPFTVRRVDVEASRHKSSHGELIGDDYFALSFWFEACLIVFFAGPYAVDFVRHRARLVTRELAHLLALLDEPPPASTNVAPIPE
jgi:hypothetical protein